MKRLFTLNMATLSTGTHLAPKPAQYSIPLKTSGIKAEVKGISDHTWKLALAATHSTCRLPTKGRPGCVDQDSVMNSASPNFDTVNY